MDYYARHGQDVCSFDLPSTHRLPTVSAAQALEGLRGDSPTYVSTGLPDLDRALTWRTSTASDEKGGLPKGLVTEIWGPPGVGKTAVGIQAAVQVLRDGRSVVWVDCLHPVCHERFTDFYNATPSNEDGSAPNHLDKLVHFSCPTLAHFIALLCRPTLSSVPSDTALIVIDSLSALLNHAFPRISAPKEAGKANKGPSPSSRRIQILQYIIGALQKLAATRNSAVLVLSQCATRMQAERGATLTPAVNANVWEQGIFTRVALYRDWVWSNGRTLGARLATVQKVDGTVFAEALEKVVAFEVESTGLVLIHYDKVQPADAMSYTPAQKRKLDNTGFEVPDSEDEYGWGEEDTSALPGQPPQWQGSEDIILGTLPDTDAEEEEDDDSNQVDDPNPDPHSLPHPANESVQD